MASSPRVWDQTTLVFLCGPSDPPFLDTPAKVIACVCAYAREWGFACGKFRSGARDCVRVYYNQAGVRKLYRFDAEAVVENGVRTGYMVTCSSADKGFRAVERIDAYATEQRCLRQVANLFRRVDEFSCIR